MTSCKTIFNLFEFQLKKLFFLNYTRKMISTFLIHLLVKFVGYVHIHPACIRKLRTITFNKVVFESITPAVTILLRQHRVVSNTWKVLCSLKTLIQWWIETQYWNAPTQQCLKPYLTILPPISLPWTRSHVCHHTSILLFEMRVK